MLNNRLFPVVLVWPKSGRLKSGDSPLTKLPRQTNAKKRIDQGKISFWEPDFPVSDQQPGSVCMVVRWPNHQFRSGQLNWSNRIVPLIALLVLNSADKTARTDRSRVLDGYRRSCPQGIPHATEMLVYGNLKYEFTLDPKVWFLI